MAFYVDNKNVDMVHNILENMSFSYLSKEFHYQIATYLEIEDFYSSLITAISKKIVIIYKNTKGDFQKYLAIPKRYNPPVDVKDFIWKVLKKYDEEVRERQYFMNSSRHFRQPNFNDTMHNPSMNMVNMFLNVPELNSTDEIENFQRKMFDIFKKAIPPVTNTMESIKKSVPRFINPQEPNIPPKYHWQPSQNQFSFCPNMSMNSLNYSPSNHYQAPVFQPFKSSDLGSEPQRDQNIFRQSFYPQNSRNWNSQYRSQRNIYERSPQIPKNFSSENKINIPNFGQREQPLLSSRMEELRNGGDIVDQPRKLYKEDHSQKVSIFSSKNNLQKLTSICCSCSTNKNQRCLYCQIINLDPSHEVLQVLSLHKLSSDYPGQIISKVKFEAIEQIKNHPQEYEIQMRSFEVGQNNEIGDISWPDGFEIKVDKEAIMKFDQNSQIKKKQGIQPILISKNIELEGVTNSLEISIGNSQSSQEQIYFKPITYAIGVFFVKQHSLQHIKKILTRKMGVKNISSCIQEQKKSETQEFTLSPFDPVTKQLIQEPVRGDQCRHLQCFDFKAYLTYTILGNNDKWKCPICHLSIKNFLKDQQLSKILNSLKSNQQFPLTLKFDRDGNLIKSPKQRADSPKNDLH